MRCTRPGVLCAHTSLPTAPPKSSESSCEPIPTQLRPRASAMRFGISFAPLSNSTRPILEDRCRLIDHFSHDLSGRFDFLHETNTLSGEKVHQLDVTAGVLSWRNPTEPRQRQACSAERNLADNRLVRSLLRAAVLLRQPSLNKGSTQCAMGP